MAKFPFTKKNEPAPKDVAVACVPPTTGAEFTAVIQAWQSRIAELTLQILTLEKAGVPRRDQSGPVRDDALRLLDGGHPIPVAEINTPAARLTALHRERDMLNTAIELSKVRMVKILAAEANVRFEQHRAELDGTMRAAALALIQLERALQERDLVLRKINSPGPIQEYCGWLLAGRLEVQGFTQCSRFLNYAQSRGWISKRELADELARVQQRPR